MSRNGASDEARTRYLHLGKVALYQMSYTRNNSDYYNRESKNVKYKMKKFLGNRALSVTADAVPAPPQGEPGRGFQCYAACLALWGSCPVCAPGGEGPGQ